MMRRMLALLILALIPTAAMAEYSKEVEIHAQQMEKKIMAPCCWAGPLDGHYSSIAEKMKGEIRAKLAAGQTEDSIIEGFVAQYGDRIRAEPKASGFDTLVWVLPPLALVAGLVGAFLVMRHWMKNSPIEDPVAASTYKADGSDWPSDEEVRKHIEKEIAAL